MAAKEWTCPRCGLVGDHHKTPDSKRCDECCAHDAALEMLGALRTIWPWFASRGESAPMTHTELEAATKKIRTVIAEAEGKA